MIINDRQDFDALPKAEQDTFKARLAAGIYGWSWQDGDWVQTTNTASLEQFGFTVEDFPDAPVPDKPTSNPDEEAKAQEIAERIAELKRKLEETDYKVLPDYDKPSDEIKTQRQKWRDEIRQLEGNQ